MRSEEQSLLIERILVLIRNVLQIPANPQVECRADNDASLHDQVIWALHQSGILDLILFVISSPDEHQFHLHGLEILCLLYREQVKICKNFKLKKKTYKYNSNKNIKNKKIIIKNKKILIKNKK